MQRKSLAPYILAALIFLTGVGTFAGFLFYRLSGLEDKLLTVVVPGAHDLTLNEPGNYTIFHEYCTVVGDEIYASSSEIAGLKVRVTSQKTGATVPISPASSASHYDIGGRAGRSAFDFQIDEAGVYRLEADYAEGQTGPKLILAVSKGFVGDILFTVFLGIAILLGSMIVSVAITVITILKRQKAARAAVALNPIP